MAKNRPPNSRGVSQAGISFKQGDKVTMPGWFKPIEGTIGKQTKSGHIEVHTKDGTLVKSRTELMTNANHVTPNHMKPADQQDAHTGRGGIGFDESKHPRNPAGDKTGGEFRPK